MIFTVIGIYSTGRTFAIHTEADDGYSALCEAAKEVCEVDPNAELVVALLGEFSEPANLEFPGEGPVEASIFLGEQ